MDPATASSPTSIMVRNADGTYSQSTVTRQQYDQMTRRARLRPHRR
jgi:hypothetical protein